MSGAFELKFKEPWVLDDLAQMLFEWPHFVTSVNDDLDWLLVHDHLAVNFGDCNSLAGVRGAIETIAERYARNRYMEARGFRKKAATELFEAISVHGKIAATKLQELTSDHVKVALEQTTGRNFAGVGNADKMSNELQGLIAELEADLLTVGLASNPDQTDFMNWAVKLQKICRLLELVGQRVDLVDSGGNTNVHRRFSPPSNWELFHNVNVLFIRAERYGCPDKMDRLEEFFKGIHQAVSGVVEVDFRATYSKYFSASATYLDDARRLRVLLHEYGYSRPEQITRALERLFRGDDIISLQIVQRQTKRADLIAAIEAQGQKTFAAKQALEKTYILQA